MPHAAPSTSVVMINRNGGAALEQCLRSLRADLDPTWSSHPCFEFLFVDNASTDQSVQLARSVLTGAPFPWRVIVESTAGVNSARNAGIRAAAHPILVFVDSDVQFAPGWLRGYLEAFDRHQTVGVFAGRVTVGRIDGPVPAWLDIDGPFCRTNIVVQLDYGEAPVVRALSTDAGPVGPSMAIRRAIIEQHGEFDTSFGLRPGSLVAGAEAEYFDRLSRAGVAFAWVPEAVVEHPLRRSQLSKAYFLRRLAGTGRVVARLSHSHADQRATRILGMTSYRLRELVSWTLHWMYGVVAYDAKRAFYLRGQAAIVAGFLAEEWRIWREMRRAAGRDYVTRVAPIADKIDSVDVLERR